MKQSVSSLFQLYLSRSDLRESSVAIKSRAVGYFVEAFGDMDVDMIRYAHAEDYRTCLAKGREKESANIYLKNIKPLFNWMVRCGHITQSPFEGLGEYRVGRKKRKLYAAEEIERIMKVMDAAAKSSSRNKRVSALRWKVIVLLALSSLRRAEVLNLVVSDIDFDKGYILVSPKKATKETWPWEIKNHNEAIVPLPEIIKLPGMELNFHMLVIDLIDSLENQPYMCLTSRQYNKMMGHQAAGTLTWEMCNSPWRSFSQDFRKLLKRANVIPRRFQDLRGTFATKMLTNGCSLVETQRLLRHASPSTTAMHYANIEEQELVAKSAAICEECYVS